MNNVSELFAVSAVVLLLFALLAPFIIPTGSGMGVFFRGTGYILPPAPICYALASALCFFAATYSLYMLPFNRAAAIWHFCLTIIGISGFCLALYFSGRGLDLPSPTAVWTVFVSPAVLLLAQIIFVWNIIHAILRMPRLDN